MPEIQNVECSENKSIRYDLSTQSISLAEGSGGRGGGKNTYTTEVWRRIRQMKQNWNTKSIAFFKSVPKSPTNWLHTYFWSSNRFPKWKQQMWPVPKWILTFLLLHLGKIADCGCLNYFHYNLIPSFKNSRG